MAPRTTRSNLTRRQRRARALHEATLVDAGTVRRPGAAGELNEETGLIDTDAPVVVYEGACQLVTPDPSSVHERDQEDVTTIGSYLKVPTTSGPYRIGDVAEIDKWQAPDVPRLWRVVGVHPKRWSTHQRLEVEEVVSGG